MSRDWLKWTTNCWILSCKLMFWQWPDSSPYTAQTLHISTDDQFTFTSWDERIRFLSAVSLSRHKGGLTVPFSFLCNGKNKNLWSVSKMYGRSQRDVVTEQGSQRMITDKPRKLLQIRAEKKIWKVPETFQYSQTQDLILQLNSESP